MSARRERLSDLCQRFRCGHSRLSHSIEGCAANGCHCSRWQYPGEQPEPQHDKPSAVDVKSDEILDAVRAHYERAYRERVRTWLREQSYGWGTQAGNGMRWAADNLPE